MSLKRLFLLFWLPFFTLLFGGGLPLSAQEQPADPPTKQLSVDVQEKVSQALAKRLEINYDRTPLIEVARDLQRKLVVPVELDERALSSVGISHDTPVVYTSTRVSARAAIALMLDQLRLVMVARYGALLITTPCEADEIADPRIYDISDLIYVGDKPPGEEQQSVDLLIDLISSCVSPQTWDTGRKGQISCLSVVGIEAIGVDHIPRVQEEIGALLSHLRAVRHQGDGSAGEGRALPEPLVPPLSPAERAIRHALAAPVKLKYEQFPLEAVAKHLEDLLDVPVRLNFISLADYGIGADTPVTFAVSNVSAEAAIALMLRPLDLSTVVHDESLIITTTEDAEYRLFTRVYDVYDLLPRRSKRIQRDFDELVDMITSCIEPSSWSDVGGAGLIAPFQSSGIAAVVAFQNEKTHRAIEDCLSQLRSLRHVSDSDRQTSYEPLSPRISEAEEAFRKALKKPISIHFKEVPLSRVVDTLREKTGLPILLDVKAIKSSPISDPFVEDNRPAPNNSSQGGKNTAASERASDPVDKIVPQIFISAEANDIQLESALFLMLHPLRLTWTYYDGCLLITTASGEEDFLFARCYDIFDMPAGRNELGEVGSDYDEIISFVTSIAAWPAWCEIGGVGAIAQFQGDGIQAIVVCQTWQNHRKVESLLDELRRLRGRAPTKEDIEKLPQLSKPPITVPEKSKSLGGGFF